MNVIFKQLGFCLKLFVSKDEKKHLAFYNGNSFVSPKVEDLIELKELLQNSIDNFENVSVFIQNENENLKSEVINSNTKPLPKRNEKKVGFIYLIKCLTTGFYKIGMTTKKVEDRVKQLKTANANIELQFYYKVNDVIDVENKLHCYFKSKNVNREWFNLNSVDLEYFKYFVTTYDL